MILRVHPERHGRATATSTIAFPRVRVIHQILTVASLGTLRLVSAYDLGSLPISLTLVLVVSTLGNVDLEWQDPDFKDFVFSIPPDCPTSTPVASMKRASRKSSATRGKAALAGVGLSLGTTRAIKATKH